MGDEGGDQNALVSDPVDVIIEKLLRYVRSSCAIVRSVLHV